MGNDSDKDAILAGGGGSGSRGAGKRANTAAGGRSGAGKRLTKKESLARATRAARGMAAREAAGVPVNSRTMNRAGARAGYRAATAGARPSKRTARPKRGKA